MSRYDQAVRLIEQLEAMHAFENGLIAREDWDRFDCEQLLRVARGETTLDAIVWGYDTAQEDEAAKLKKWNEMAARSTKPA